MNLKMKYLLVFLTATAMVSQCKKTPDSALGAAEAAKEAVKNGNPGAIFALLPGSYKKDVNELAQGYAAAIDKTTYENLAPIPGKVITGFEKGKDKLKGNKMVKRMAGKKTDLDQVVKGLSQLWSALDSAGITSHDKMTSIDVQKTLDSHGKDIMGAIQTLAKSSKKGDFDKITGQLKAATFKVIEESADKTVIEFKSEKRTQKVTFVKVEDKWIPAALQKQWPKMMKRNRKDLKRFKKMMKKRGKKLKKNSAKMLKMAEKFEETGDLGVVMKAARLAM